VLFWLKQNADYRRQRRKEERGRGRRNTAHSVAPGLKKGGLTNVMVKHGHDLTCSRVHKVQNSVL
jgi:hypothetical protein